MDVLFLLFVSAIVGVLAVFSLKYLSLLRWISGNAYVLSKRKNHFSILEILDLFKNVRPFPISNQKGWKIDSYAHGHRIWFNFLTFPHNINAPSIKVFAAFDRIASSSQALLQVLRDVSQTCDWKPGVISVSHTHCPKSHEVPSASRGLPSMPVQADCIKEERLIPSKSKFSLQYPDLWVNENVIPTVSVEFKRFWHREDNGVCWLLQMNEKLQTCEFFLIQPVADVEQCLLSVVTWSLNSSQTSRQRASVLLSSLEEYVSVRRLQKTPLLSITLPQDVSDDNHDSSDSSQSHGDGTLFSPLKKLTKSSLGIVNGAVRQAEIEKYSHILRFRGTSINIKDSPNNNGGPPLLKRSQSDASALRKRIPGQDVKIVENNDDKRRNDCITEEANEDEVEDRDTGELSEPESDAHLSEEDLQIVRYKTLSNQSAAELLAEAVRASNLDLQLTPDKQAESSRGWMFSSFEKNIVVLKKVHSGSTIQSYIGKGFVLAPPKTVWDAVRNPRTRFTYDDTLKKVDIIESMDSALKIVYYYHESQQFMSKTSCDMCVLQGEREEGDKFVLTYSGVTHGKCPVNPGVKRAKLYPSGWIIEPARQDNKIYSIVTYVMQIDFGSSVSDSSDKLPFEEMISRYPLSISYLQQYLKPALRLLRRKSLT